MNSEVSDMLQRNVMMNKYTTFRTGGPADFFAEPENEHNLCLLIKELTREDIPFVILGNGSNTVFRDGGFAGAVISTSRLKAINIKEDVISCGAGTLMSEVARAAAKHSLSGMEFMSGIPGSIGGAVYMNAGAYGYETSDIIIKARSMDISGNIREYEREQLDMAYRHSVFCAKQEVILSADFALNKSDALEITALMKTLNQKRREKQPLEYPSSGSTFKRPKGYYAAKLIEDAGLKGFTVGGAQVSEKHSGFIVNRGGATTNDLLALIDYVKKVVYETSGVCLEEEVKIVGRDKS